LKPSQADLSLTRRLVEAGKLLDLLILDHLILTKQGYFSFRDEGFLALYEPAGIGIITQKPPLLCFIYLSHMAAHVFTA